MPTYPPKEGYVREYYELPEELVKRVQRWRKLTPGIDSKVAAVRRLLDEALTVYEERMDLDARRFR